MKNLLKRYLLFIVGLYFLAAGIVLILRSSLGTTPISSVNYVLSLNTTFSLGTWTFLINLLLIIGQFWFVRDRMNRRDTIDILLQIPFSFLFGLFIDLNMLLTTTLQPHHYIISIAVLLLGCLVQAVGVVLEIKPRVTMMSAEGFVSYASRRYHKDFGKLKVAFDVTLVTLALILSLLLAHKIEGVREGTVIAALIVGPIVHFISPYYKCLDNWIGDGKKQSEPEAVANSNHTIITIAREYGSGGHLLGEMVAKELGIPFYDKELIELAAKKSGLSEKYVSQNEQSMSQLWLKNIILHNHESSLGFSLSSRDALFVAQCHVVRELASKGSCVIIGRCADSVLDDYSKVIKVFCYSTVEDECLRCTSEYGVEPDKAETEVKRINRARATHYEYYTGKKWGDSHNYDLMINTGSMSMSTACKLITSLAR